MTNEEKENFRKLCKEISSWDIPIGKTIWSVKSLMDCWECTLEEVRSKLGDDGLEENDMVMI